MAMTFSHDLDPALDRSRRGRVVVLNGTSSSGKSSLAGALQQRMDQPWFHLPIDRWHTMRGPVVGDEPFDRVFQRTVLGFLASVGAMARAGNHVIVDVVLGERWRLRELLAAAAGLDLVLVRVFCPLEELVRREHDRGNRTAGIAAMQYPLVHAGIDHDVTVDTSTASPEACAEVVAAYLRSLGDGPWPPAAAARA